MTAIGQTSHQAPAAGSSRPILLFDGACNLCNATVQFIIRHDRKGIFRFASLQGVYGKNLLSTLGMPDITPDTSLLQANGKVYQSSESVLRTLRHLGFPWSLSFAFILLPARWRDAVYAFVARNRYRWFGKRETCYLPTPELKGRFLD
ncbi:MAG: thiol-disulfide oxidoreductase DCC family protein [Bacteroidetes bacterium]|nr:thiol-disulfide oxidoreductase DCC family protein [Bacteroidota bacterium]